MKSLIDLRSLSARMILGFVAVVMLTAITVGFPALWLIRHQLDNQAWSQVNQGCQAAQAIYAANESQIANLANLITRRPTISNMIAIGDRAALGDYLQTIQSGTGLDFLAVCGPGSFQLALAGDTILGDMCGNWDGSGFYLAPGGSVPRVWLVASHSVLSEGEKVGEVIIGDEIDDGFATQMRAQTGLEHTLVLHGQPLVTSFTDGIIALEQVSHRPVSPVGCEGTVRNTFFLDNQPYYAARIPLNSSGLEVEVALPVGEITGVHTYLAGILAGSIFVVATIVSVVGVILARRISRPLVRLESAAANFSQGDLTTSAAIDSEVREVVQLSQALERARVDLLRTLTDLRREKDWINHLLESIVEGIVTLDDQMKITFFSHGAERITSWGREQVLNRRCDEVFRFADTNLPFSQFIPAPGMQNKLIVELDDGRQATLSFTGARLAPSEAGEAQVALVFRDVSEEESVHRLLGQFLANVSHEFRTPLSALAASIELLLDQAHDLPPGELEELLQSLYLGILSLQTLVDNLLESASIEAGHFRVFPRSYDLSAIFSEAVNTMQPLLTKYGQQLVVDLPDGFPKVQADPRRTTQVLVNLLSNASRYGPPDHEITLSARVEEGCVVVRVSDRGPGIPAGYRKDLFRRFVFPGPEANLSKVGVGLGLSVVKAVVEAQGGWVGVDDRPAGGSIFWFTLPLASES